MADSSDMLWDDAIQKVLGDAYPNPLHYADIAEKIVEQGLREKVGANPPNQVYATIYQSRKGANDSPYVKRGKGFFLLRKMPEDVDQDVEPGEGNDKAPAISVGWHWKRAAVDWKKAQPPLRGVWDGSKQGRESVDFSEQIGVYLLHDKSKRVVYAGRTTGSKGFGGRLKDHTTDDLGNKWSRFSWFGFREVDERGRLGQGELVDALPEGLGQGRLVKLMEMMLIQALEPSENKKSGDMREGEFIIAGKYEQVPDPKSELVTKKHWIEEMLRDLEA